MPNVLVQLFNQILEGYDIPTPQGVLRVANDRALLEVPGLPYSLGVNLAHAVRWQDFWLTKLKGGRKSSSMHEWSQDFRVPDSSEIGALKQAFVSGLLEARTMAENPDVSGVKVSPEEAAETLLRIAIHGAYHLGQMNLIKRAMKGLSA